MASLKSGYEGYPEDSGFRLAQHVAHSVFNPGIGYDLVAADYDDWKWQQIWRRFEWPLILDSLKQIECGPAKSVLDIGAGTGTYLALIVDEFSPERAVGIDVSRNMLAQAERKVRGTQAELKYGDARNPPFADNTFDVALMCRVASHIDDPQQAAREAFRVLRPGGWLILTDIVDAHHYEHTRIPFAGTKISIETFRHSVEEWMRVAQKVHFRTQSHHSISSRTIKDARLNNLPRTLRDNPDHDVAFVLLAQKPLITKDV